MKIAAVIVAGGRSSRMGREKAFELVAGETILSRTIARLSSQVAALVINANGETAQLRQTGLPLIPDLRDDVGTPLAGVHAALAFAARDGFDAVLTVPSDCPFLPSDLVEKLEAATGATAIAASAGQAHYLTGLWPVVLLPRIEKALGQPRTPRLQDWVSDAGAAIIEWPSHPYDPFFNVNTPDELAEANRIAAEFAA